MAGRRERSASLDSLGRRRRRGGCARKDSDASSASSSSSSDDDKRRSRHRRDGRDRRSRSRSRERRRHRSRSPDGRRRDRDHSRRRGRSDSRSRSRSRSATLRGNAASTARSDTTTHMTNGFTPKTSALEISKPDDKPVATTTQLSEEEQMRLLLGFGDFDSTKGKAVEDNAVGAARGATRKESKREYRQYMNRRGGFNRPLEK